MNQPTLKSRDPFSQLDAPPRPELRWIRWCLIGFLFSFAADLPLPDAALEIGGTIDSALPPVFLTISLVSGGIALLIGLRHLFVRPGAYLILLCFGSLAFTVVNGLAQDQEPAALARSLVTALLLCLGVTTTHLAACAGMRAGEMIRYFLIAAGCGLSFQLSHGILADSFRIDLANLRFLSPLPGFLIALATCALLLRRTITRKTLALTALLIAAVTLGVAGGLAVPILIPAAAAGACLALGMNWRLFPRDQLWKRFTPIGILMLIGAIQLTTTSFPALSFFGLAGAGSTAEVIGSIMVPVIFLIAMGMSLRAARRNSETIMGRWAQDAFLMFLPLVGLSCLLSAGFIGTAFDQPFTAALAGMVAAMPQFFFNRAFYLRHRENEAAIAPQLILNEEDLPSTWEGAFPTNA